MLENLKLEHLLVLDIETVPAYPDFEDLDLKSRRYLGRAGMIESGFFRALLEGTQLRNTKVSTARYYHQRQSYNHAE